MVYKRRESSLVLLGANWMEVVVSVVIPAETIAAFTGGAPESDGIFTWLI